MQTAAMFVSVGVAIVAISTLAAIPDHRATINLALTGREAVALPNKTLRPYPGPVGAAGTFQGVWPMGETLCTVNWILMLETFI